MKRNFILPLCLFLCCFICCQCKTTAAKDKESVSPDKTSVTIKGRITVKGNEPHTYLVIITEDKMEYTIVGDLES
ncbi:MAG: hypothetical protein OQK82_06370, partial [Candidatus Pacearchaeota archaeon]|nr:hypothetical protein [Candidatus Pacearchaeota archaeon]